MRNKERKNFAGLPRRLTGRENRKNERAGGKAEECAFQPGECCRFCKQQGSCKALAEVQIRYADGERRAPEKMTAGEMAEILNKAESFLAWAKAVKAYALEEALKGTTIPGWVLHEGKTKRRYVDELEVIRRVEKMGLDPYEKKLMGIPALEKLMGKSSFEKQMADLIETPRGEMSLVKAGGMKDGY